METGRIFVSDFDGTMTDRDIYLLIADRYLPASAPEYFAEYRAGRMTHFEAMRAYLSQGPTDPSEWQTLMADAGLDAAAGDAAAVLQDAGWEIVVASAGSSWYIERMLAQHGVRDVAIHGNPGRLQPGRGLWIEEPVDSPFYSREVGVDKQAIVRDALKRAELVAFAGDGPPDVPPALLVRPELRFARGWLADELRRRGEAFQKYTIWSEIASKLTTFDTISGLSK